MPASELTSPSCGRQAVLDFDEKRKTMCVISFPARSDRSCPVTPPSMRPGQMVEAASDACRIQNGRSENSVSSRSRPAAHKRYRDFRRRGSGSAPATPPAAHRARTDCRPSAESRPSATCRSPAARQSRSSFAGAHRQAARHAQAADVVPRGGKVDHGVCFQAHSGRLLKEQYCKIPETAQKSKPYFLKRRNSDRDPIPYGDHMQQLKGAETT